MEREGEREARMEQDRERERGRGRAGGRERGRGREGEGEGEGEGRKGREGDQRRDAASGFTPTHPCLMLQTGRWSYLCWLCVGFGIDFESASGGQALLTIHRWLSGTTKVRASGG
eukprot:2500902-Rhodomonas_salina.1